jgi:hypothetical protein
VETVCSEQLLTCGSGGVSASGTATAAGRLAPAAGRSEAEAGAITRCRASN